MLLTMAQTCPSLPMRRMTSALPAHLFLIFILILFKFYYWIRFSCNYFRCVHVCAFSSNRRWQQVSNIIVMAWTAIRNSSRQWTITVYNTGPNCNLGLLPINVIADTILYYTILYYIHYIKHGLSFN